MDAEDVVLTDSIRTAELHSDTLGEWVVIDDGPEYGGVLAVPATWEHRQPLSRVEAAERFAAINSVPTELAAIRRAFDALDTLDARGQGRAISWLADRFGVTTAGDDPEPLPPAPTDRRGRREWLQRAWMADTPIDQIASGLGITVPGVNAFVYRMRREGWDLPKRKRSAHGVSPREER